MITDQEHFNTGPLYATGPGRDREADETRSSAVTPRTRLIARRVLWTTGRRSTCTVKRESGLPVLADGAQSAGAIEPDVGDLTSTPSAQSGSAHLTPPAPCTSATRR